MAVLQLKKNATVSNKGSHQANDLIAVYEDSEVPEPASPTAKLYFIRVSGVKTDYLDLLEEYGEEEYQEGQGRKKYSLDISSLSQQAKREIQKYNDTIIPESVSSVRARILKKS